MKINNINNQSLLPVSKKTPGSKADGKIENTDSIDISLQARELMKNEKSSKLNEIKQKLNENFYSRKEVLEKTAEAILKELKPNK